MYYKRSNNSLIFFILLKFFKRAYEKEAIWKDRCIQMLKGTKQIHFGAKKEGSLKIIKNKLKPFMKIAKHKSFFF